MVAVDIKNYTGYTIELEDSKKGCRIMSYKRYKEGKELKITIQPSNKGKYKRWRITLYNDKGQMKHLTISRLILQHFKPDEWDEKLQADHIDCNSLNNRINNLRMITHQQNMQNQSSNPRTDNKSSGHKNIHYDEDSKLWRFRKIISGLKYNKNFKTLEDAVEFKKMFLIIHNCK
tara:strand:+ start:934 stop:1458 length:525 start_codon:yes stop_codon:yes gene_type:complete